MTTAPQPHCEHECVCNWLACNVNCDTLNEPCKRKDCDNDTRSHPDPQPQPISVTMKMVNEMLEDEECQRAYQRGYENGLRSRPHTSTPHYQIEPNSNEYTLSQIVEINERLRKEAAAIRNATLDSVQKILREGAQIDDNDQYYLWLEDAECAVESMRGEP